MAPSPWLSEPCVERGLPLWELSTSRDNELDNELGIPRCFLKVFRYGFGKKLACRWRNRARPLQACLSAEVIGAGFLWAPRAGSLLTSS